MIGAIEPKASNRHHFILVVIDYFTKWVEYLLRFVVEYFQGLIRIFMFMLLL